MPAIQLGNQWREIRLAEAREEERILRRLSALAGQAGQDLLVTLDLMARLDLALAKGHYSMDQRATAPWVANGEGEGRNLQLTGARHPLLAGRVVPISMELGGENQVMLITGPNAGGKTVTLKTVGLLALMAHAGLHVPAEAAHFPLFDGIYADIGDQQSIQQSLSTFSSHLQNLCSIMTQATVKSLVLVDELGTSTDPEEGSALAEGILHYFQSRGVLLVATTHHRSVARYVQQQPGMINASLDLHPQTLEPTYRITLGVPGRSYALTIAARLGLAPEIIEHARSRLPAAEQAAETLLRDLQEERRLVDQLRQEAEATLALARQQQADTEVRLASVETAKIELVETARQELQNRIGDLLARLQEAERAVTQPVARSPLQEHRRQLEEARRQVTSPQWHPIELQGPTWQRQIVEGDRVFIRGIPRPVEVITPPDAEGQVEVLLGAMRAKVPAYQLQRFAGAGVTTVRPELVEGPPSGGSTSPDASGSRQSRDSPRSGLSVSRPSPRPASIEIDLRGLRVEEALERTEKFLNDATLDDLSPVRIIHGKGTGALRRAIGDYLANHPLVASSALAEGSGGDGVTVVELA
jgi:DNA mismatch repair protein MutS2